MHGEEHGEHGHRAGHGAEVELVRPGARHRRDAEEAQQGGRDQESQLAGARGHGAVVVPGVVSGLAGVGAVEAGGLTVGASATP